jgi:hypothetical protein
VGSYWASGPLPTMHTGEPATRDAFSVTRGGQS